MKNKSKPKENQDFQRKTNQNLRKTNIFNEKQIKTLGKPTFALKNQSKPQENQNLQ